LGPGRSPEEYIATHIQLVCIMDADLSLLDDDFENLLLGDEPGPFRLLDLPPEIWLRVCEFAVVRRQPIFLDCTRKQREDMSNSQPSRAHAVG